MHQPVQGIIYAVDTLHKEISIEQDNGLGRLIIQPEEWNEAQMIALLEKRTTVYAMGMEAAGLPVLMRARVQWLEWE